MWRSGPTYQEYLRWTLAGYGFSSSDRGSLLAATLKCYFVAKHFLVTESAAITNFEAASPNSNLHQPSSSADFVAKGCEAHLWMKSEDLLRTTCGCNAAIEPFYTCLTIWANEGIWPLTILGYCQHSMMRERVTVSSNLIHKQVSNPGVSFFIERDGLSLPMWW